MLRFLPKLITAIGVICLSIGVAWALIYERTDLRSTFLTDYTGSFIVMLIVGSFVSAAGTLAWAKRFSRRKKLRVAAWIFFAGIVGMVIGPSNVHGSGMLLVLPAVCSWILAIILAVMALAYGDSSAN